MNKLTQEQQQLILDFYFRCGEQEDIQRGRDLIASNPEASMLYANLELSLTDLDHIKYEPCPDNLVDLTIARLKIAASCVPASNSRLHQLLEQQQAISAPETHPVHSPQNSVKNPKRNFFRPAFEILAAAASIAVGAGILFPSFGAMRSRAQQNACAYNLGQIGTAFSAYANDNNGQFASAQVQAGSPWWKIGDQGPQPQSVTRGPFQLVKDGYAEGILFVCPGYPDAQPLQDNPSRLRQLQDFPLRQNVTFSFSILPVGTNSRSYAGRRIIIAGDLNPVFKKIHFDPSTYQQMNEFEKIMLDEQLKKIMSDNHHCRGQNVLYSDTSTIYVKTRIVDGDDIFTIDGVDIYAGREIPFSISDIFLAP